MPRALRRIAVVVAGTFASHACGSQIGEPSEGTVLVNIEDNFFDPQAATVPRGKSVRWTNNGTALHTVVSDSQLWQSDSLRQTFWFEVRFEEAGTFDYHCSIHAGMTGTVTVQ